MWLHGIRFILPGMPGKLILRIFNQQWTRDWHQVMNPDHYNWIKIEVRVIQCFPNGDSRGLTNRFFLRRYRGQNWRGGPAVEC